ncbi:hypothetical protein A4A49_51456 [Nicotiana attenuata]|uniref:Reverse transcriptase domain-containing protein n=1 Tax=Nicotiana attenuata TaxID=49451 RepID=A0A1J6IYL9_NICAT|nr:hypothetical protein A4A49_51456 [Nicotiana attenuata]
MPTYCSQCKVQGHSLEKCRAVQHEKLPEGGQTVMAEKDDNVTHEGRMYNQNIQNGKWKNVEKKRGKGMNNNGTSMGQQQNKSNNNEKNVNIEEQDSTQDHQDTQQQERTTRWDKDQKDKEKEKNKKQQTGLNIRSTRIRNTTNNNKVNAEIQGEMISLIIKDPKECKVMRNKKKFAKTITIPEGITLQGETRDISGTESTGSNRVEEIDVGEQNKNKEQESRYNISHEPPNLDPSIAEERDEYEEVFHDLDVMETNSTIINNEEERKTQSDDELTRVNISSVNQKLEYPESTPGVDFIQECQTTEEIKEQQKEPTPRRSLERLQTIKQQFQIPLICLQEPLVDSGKIDRYRRKLDMNHGCFNCSNKIWIFWIAEVDVTIIQDKEQHVLISAKHLNHPAIFLTIVYAKCNEESRRELWQDLKNTSNNIQGAWGVIRDFNVITSSEEKKVSALMSVVFKMQVSQGQYIHGVITEILPLLFGRDWIDFSKIVHGLILYPLRKALSVWSIQAFGDIYEVPKSLEAEMRILEDNCVTEFTRYFKIQESILRQKARDRWFKEGDANTANFHSLEGNDVIVEVVVRHFQGMFTQECHTTNFNALKNIERCISDDDNNMLKAIPTIHEIKEAVFNMDKDSAPGPDGLSGYFYQSAWDIIRNDLHRAEIINDIRKPSRGGNVVIKLDMAKAYDRVSWEFLCMALKNLASVSGGYILFTTTYPTIGTLLLLMEEDMASLNLTRV